LSGPAPGAEGGSASPKEALSRVDLEESDQDVLALPPIEALSKHLGLWLPSQPSPAAELALKRAVVSCLDTIQVQAEPASGASPGRRVSESVRLQVEDVIARAADSAPAQSEPVRLLRKALNMLASEFEQTTKLEAAQVRRLGGLYVVGTSKHESRRIDNQLRGRAGRQGDPGGTRFFLSLEDDLFKSFGADKIAPMLEQFRVAEDMPIESELVVQALDKVQTQVEAYFQANRQQIFRLDEIMSTQRATVYRQRRDLLSSTDENISQTFASFALTTMDEILLAAVVMPGNAAKPASLAALPASASVDAAKLVSKAVQFFPNIALTASDVSGAALAGGALQALLHTRLRAAIDNKKALLSQGSQWAFPSMARYLSIIQVDESWCKHLTRLDLLKEEMVLQSFTAEKDVMITYQERAAKLFSSLLDDVRRNTVYSLMIYDPAKPSRA
jgi:preprotein translocase subunit SecA